MRIGVFGGSFDPIHHGHLIVAGLLAELLALDQVRVIPAREQPLKVGSHAASAQHRLAMVELATAASPMLQADRIEVERPGPSYTVDTLRALAAQQPGARLLLLLGSDAAVHLPRWKEAATLRELAEVVVFQRNGEAAPAVAAHRTVTVPAIEISSTDLRARVRAGQSVRYWVPDAVECYIAEHGLYRE